MNVTVRGRARHYRTVTFDAQRNHVLLIEQRLLPHEFKIVATRDYRETAAAITDMVVRGAGAIGATAAYGLAQGVRAFRGADMKKFSRHASQVFKTLKDARPTAVDPVKPQRIERVLNRLPLRIEDPLFERHMNLGLHRPLLPRMLKKSASGVLASFRPSTYPRGYASALHSLWPCWTAFLSIPKKCSPLCHTCRPLKFSRASIVSPQHAGAVRLTSR